VNAKFVPVALKAGLVDHPPDDAEGRLYREIRRSRIEPQGICVVNSAGKVLDWTFWFDDDKSVLAFLDHSLKRYAQFPDARKPVPAERYRKFPSDKLADVEDSAKVPPPVNRHPQGECCPAKPRLQQGTIVARVFGRALDQDGKPLADTLRQEHYVEDRFHLSVAMQERLAKALADAGKDRFRLADDLARLLVSHAFLGILDVNPLGGLNGSKGALKQCEFWAQQVETAGKGPVQIRVEGKSESAGVSSAGRNGDDRLWQHEVKLTWEGLIELKEKRMSQLLLLARGTERFQWGNKVSDLTGQLWTRLPMGHAIDLRCGVRYGIIGEPVPNSETGFTNQAGGLQGLRQEFPDETRKQLVEALGGGLFIVLRDKVQEELRLSDPQKEKLLSQVPDYRQETMNVLEKIQDLEPRKRDKEMQEHRKESEEKLSALLKDLLQPRQQDRLFQLQLQQAGHFALLGENEAFKKLKITDDQRKKFRDVVQQMEKRLQALMKEAQSGVKPEEIFPKVVKLRKEHDGKIEALLTEAQKKHWLELLGKPFDLGD
jgi:hypothetical protein